jgi:hypothetical protein
VELISASLFSMVQISFIYSERTRCDCLPLTGTTVPFGINDLDLVYKKKRFPLVSGAVGGLVIDAY